MSTAVQSVHIGQLDRHRSRVRLRWRAVSLAVVCAAFGASCSDSASDSTQTISAPASAVPSPQIPASAPGGGLTTAGSASPAGPTSDVAPQTDAGSLAVGESVQGNPRLTLEQLPPTLAELQQAIMSADREAFVAVFTEDAVAIDGGREFRGRDEIGEWGDREVLRPGSHYDVFEVERQSADTYRWTLAFQRAADAVAEEARGCAITRVTGDGRIAEWILGGCQL